ncbi:hypothetical protein [Bacillus sp. AF23]|uniref:hypothetical protein n=1 Tax=Bacillus sp. AF23 TaxID=2821151 RepID=UPI001E47F032|nr:hypothetical protein [Bacillus sp. AF23]MCC8351581.1 hypothetical protein [Bacillus sp. AF23]
MNTKDNIEVFFEFSDGTKKIFDYDGLIKGERTGIYSFNYNIVPSRLQQDLESFIKHNETIIFDLNETNVYKTNDIVNYTVKTHLR